MYIYMCICIYICIYIYIYIYMYMCRRCAAASCWVLTPNPKPQILNPRLRHKPSTPNS